MFTDANIEIKCAECDVQEIGRDAMEAHILKEHPAYTPLGAKFYAQQWCEDAHNAMEEFERDYGEQRKLDESIERDAFPSK